MRIDAEKIAEWDEEYGLNLRGLTEGQSSLLVRLAKIAWLEACRKCSQDCMDVYCMTAEGAATKAACAAQCAVTAEGV